MENLITLNGQESSILCLLAERPQAYEEMRHLLGTEADKIARYLSLQEKTGDDYEAAGDSIVDWAKQRKERTTHG